MEPKSTFGSGKRILPLPGSYRCYPHETGSVMLLIAFVCLRRTSSGKEETREEVARLGVKLSLSVAEFMFLLCDDDIHTMLWFCYKLWKYTLPPSDPVSERLLFVIHHVYSKDIKPKNIVCSHAGNSVQWELVKTTWNDFTDGIQVLSRLVSILREKDCSFDDRLLSSAVEKYKQQVLMKIEDKLVSAKHVSELNGFARETVESDISHLWKSLFDEATGEATSEATRSVILSDLFQPILGDSRHGEIPTLPVYSPYILGVQFQMQQLQEEVLRLGVELSLCMAESMFLLCDDIRSVLKFCLKIWTSVIMEPEIPSPVRERLLRVIHQVYSRNIKPKNGVYQLGGKSVQWELITTTWENFEYGIFKLLHSLYILIQVKGTWADGREYTSRIEQALKELGGKLRCAKDVSEANGFAREVMESNILGFWESLFDQETELPWTVTVMRDEIYKDLFQPLLTEEEEEAKQH